MTTEEKLLNQTPHQPPNETPDQTSNEKPMNDQKKKKEKDYILFRIGDKIYSLNKEDIPESGMLRTLYNDNEKEETICEIKEEFTPGLVNFVFNCIRKETILGEIISKIQVGWKMYADLIKITRFFQIDEKIIMDRIELHWIHRYQFTATDSVPPKIVNIFSGFFNETTILSLVINEKCYIISNSKMCMSNFMEDKKQKNYESIEFVLDKKEFILVKIDDKLYQLFVDKRFLTNLEPKLRSITYDSVNINFTIE